MHNILDHISVLQLESPVANDGHQASVCQLHVIWLRCAPRAVGGGKLVTLHLWAQVDKRAEVCW